MVAEACNLYPFDEGGISFSLQPNALAEQYAYGIGTLGECRIIFATTTRQVELVCKTVLSSNVTWKSQIQANRSSRVTQPHRRTQMYTSLTTSVYSRLCFAWCLNFVKDLKYGCQVEAGHAMVILGFEYRILRKKIGVVVCTLQYVTTQRSCGLYSFLPPCLEFGIDRHY